MATRISSAEWKGSLKGGAGTMRLGSGAYEGPFTFASRFETGSGTNPEELIGAAHAGCFSMAFSAILGKAGFAPKSIATEAKVHIDKIGDGFTITKIELITVGQIPGIDQATFLKHANEAKAGCPVSRALTGVEITLDAKLA